MKKIKLLFKGKVKYNTLLLGILSITTVIRLALFPQNNVWIMNIPAAILIKLFTKTTMHIQDLVFKSATLAISHSVFAVMLLLFILSCVIYIKKRLFRAEYSAVCCVGTYDRNCQLLSCPVFRKYYRRSSDMLSHTRSCSILYCKYRKGEKGNGRRKGKGRH